MCVIGAVQLDEDELKRFVRDDYRRLVASLKLLSGSQALAEDAVQEALARAAARLSRGERIDDLRAWVAVVARNLTRSAFRKLAAEARALRRSGREASQPWEDSLGTDRIALLAAVRGLRPNQREALVLFYFADLSVEEIGVMMGLHKEAVKGLLHRGRSTLARSLESSPEEEA